MIQFDERSFSDICTVSWNQQLVAKRNGFNPLTTFSRERFHHLNLLIRWYFAVTNHHLGDMFDVLSLCQKQSKPINIIYIYMYYLLNILWEMFDSSVVPFQPPKPPWLVMLLLTISPMKNCTCSKELNKSERLSALCSNLYLFLRLTQSFPIKLKMTSELSNLFETLTFAFLDGKKVTESTTGNLTGFASFLAVLAKGPPLELLLG